MAQSESGFNTIDGTSDAQANASENTPLIAIFKDHPDKKRGRAPDSKHRYTRTLKQIHSFITTNQQNAERQARLRQLLADGDQKTYRAIKGQYALGATYAGYADSKRRLKESKDFHHSGYLLIEIDTPDKKPNLEAAAALRASALEIPSVAMANISTSGSGIHTVMAITPPPKDADEHEGAWNVCAEIADQHFAREGLTPDSTQDRARLAFLAHDPDAVLKPADKVIPVQWKSLAPAATERRKAKEAAAQAQAAAEPTPQNKYPQETPEERDAAFQAAANYIQQHLPGAGTQTYKTHFLQACSAAFAHWGLSKAQDWANNTARGTDAADTITWGQIKVPNNPVGMMISIAKKLGYQPKNNNHGGKREGAGRPKRPEHQEALNAGYITTPKGYIVANHLGNIQLAMTEIGIADQFSWNLWDGRLMRTQNGETDPFNDAADLPTIIRQIESHHAPQNVSPSDSKAFAAIQALGRANSYNAVTKRLRSLEWDGIPRLDAYGYGVFGIDPTHPKAEYYAKCLGLIIRGAVTRALEPGAKFPYMPLLHGMQGMGKGEAMKVLSPGPYREGLPLEVQQFERDMKSALRGNSIVELAEIRTLLGNKLERMKRLITNDRLSAKDAYARQDTELKMTAIIVGTTNARTVLSDEENRRFTVIRVRRVDLRLLKEQVEQLWAEAVHEYDNRPDSEGDDPERTAMIFKDIKAGQAQVVLPQPLWETQNDDNVDHRQASTIEAWLDEWLPENDGKQSGFKWMDLIHALQADDGGLKKLPPDIEISNALNRLGYENNRIRINGRKAMRWVKEEEI